MSDDRNPFMSQHVDYTPSEQLFWDISEELDQAQRQLLFVLDLWHNRNENYGRVAEAVRTTAHALRKKSFGVEDQDDRKDLLRKAGRILSVISFHDEYAPYVAGSGGHRPARPSQPVKSVTPGGLPGLGKRR